MQKPNTASILAPISRKLETNTKINGIIIQIIVIQLSKLCKSLQNADTCQRLSPLPHVIKSIQQSKLPWQGVCTRAGLMRGFILPHPPQKHCFHLGVHRKSGNSGAPSRLLLWATLSTIFFLCLCLSYSCLQIISCTDNCRFLSSTRTTPYCKV